MRMSNRNGIGLAVVLGVVILLFCLGTPSAYEKLEQDVAAQKSAQTNIVALLDDAVAAVTNNLAAIAVMEAQVSAAFEVAGTELSRGLDRDKQLGEAYNGHELRIRYLESAVIDEIGAKKWRRVQERIQAQSQAELQSSLPTG